MTTDDILRAAIECQLITTGNRDGVYAASLVRFATLIRAAALAEQPVEQEKLAIMQRIVDSNTGFIRNPTTPQPAKQPLTDAEIDSLWAAIPNQALYKAVRAFARAVEATIWEKSNG